MATRDLVQNKGECAFFKTEAGKILFIFFRYEPADEDWEKFWKDLKQFFLEINVVAGFVRFSPLISQKYSKDMAITARTTMSIRMDKFDTFAAYLKSVRKGFKCNYETGVKLGLTFSMSNKDVDLGPKSPFRKIYEEVMKLREASDFYFFDDDYYNGLKVFQFCSLFFF
jgi:hypothetical protein